MHIYLAEMTRVRAEYAIHNKHMFHMQNADMNIMHIAYGDHANTSRF